jgi:hypothetical protein
MIVGTSSFRGHIPLGNITVVFQRSGWCGGVLLLIILVGGCNRKADTDWPQDSRFASAALNGNLWESKSGASSYLEAVDRENRTMSIPWPTEELSFYPDSRLFLYRTYHPNPVRTLPEIHERYVLEFIHRPGLGVWRFDWEVSEWVELLVDGQNRTLDRQDAYRLYPAQAALANGRHDQETYPSRPKYDADAETLVFSHETVHDVVKRRWTLQMMRLIGLVKHKEPVVYLGNGRPDHSARPDRLGKNGLGMNEDTIIPSRRPDRFEAAALAELRKGNELVAETSPSVMRMVGAIRARADCLKCHDGDEGTLLGAFSYTLWRESPAAKP